ncbi:lipopolysaccharide heptosyltransferase I [Marinimicrobium alkaliphilum]|uniref:lipopolysaccharide heptosyltransferase I n=1 Tax=Marinimicrobium alkaliphilum TaxID=2202654 RepID=UPI000DBA8DB4|nr:lipopolysaccharide heptosyltransferase I [Marinimicrobium alkaliphilum]
MKVLLVKMSSMGDIFHTFPAISDLKAARPDIELHWVVEENFAAMVRWHPGVDRVIISHQRRWLKQRNGAAWREFKAFRKQLRETQYDLVIDAQALIKSMLIARCARTPVVAGYDRNSLREKPATWGYHRTYRVAYTDHAVTRNRLLLAQALDYPVPETLNFGIREHFADVRRETGTLVFVVGTSWRTKLWSPERWFSLAERAAQAGYRIEVIWGSDDEHQLAQQIVEQCPAASCSGERLSIDAVARRLVAAAGVVGLDTGFAHLAGALETPTIALYGATSPDKYGLIGEHTCNLQVTPALPCMPCHKRRCALLPEGSLDTPPCMTGISAEQVWLPLQRLMKQT